MPSGPSPHLSRFTRQVRIEHLVRATSTGLWRVYRLYVGDHVVKRRISHDPDEHVEIISELWEVAKMYCLNQGRLVRLLTLEDVRAFISMPLIPERVHDMDQQHEQFDRSGDGGDSVLH